MKATLNPLPLMQVLTEIFEKFKPASDLKKIIFQLNYSIDENLTLQLDENVFRGIVTTIIDSAIKYSLSGSTTTLFVDKVENGKWIKLSVVNEASDQLKEGSDPGEWLETKDKVDLSLTLAKHMAEVMEGQLCIQDTDCTGFVYVLKWPLKESFNKDGQKDNKKLDIPDISHNHLSKRNLSHHSKSTVLVVEDQAEMLNYISEVLSTYYQVLTASNGVEAWQILKNTNSIIDLVVSDLMMPEMDGFELLEKMRGDTALVTTPVVLLTARKGDENIIKALSVGVSDYVTKPFTKEVLFAHCKHLLSNSVNKQTPIKEDLCEADIETDQKDVNKLVDLNWLSKVEKVFYAHIKNKYFNMIVLADELAISERQMRRKLKKITGMSPVQYMNEIKLNNARQMIISEKYATVSEVSYEAGFETPKYFSALFKERYGVNPSELL